jgi:transcription elongation GreA/GreB family factor
MYRQIEESQNTITNTQSIQESQNKKVIKFGWTVPFLPQSSF